MIIYCNTFLTGCLKSKEDLGPNCILRDGYVFGSPSVGDNDFASEFANYLNSPFNRQSTLWRVIDDSDIISKLHGFKDLAIRQVLDRYNLLNYVHVGEEIQFFQDGRRPKSSQRVFSLDKELTLFERLGSVDGDNDHDHDLGDKSHEMVTNEKVENFVERVERFIPSLIKNHFPPRYFEAMQKAKKYFDKEKNDTLTNPVSDLNSIVIL